MPGGYFSGTFPGELRLRLQKRVFETPLLSWQWNSTFFSLGKNHGYNPLIICNLSKGLIMAMMKEFKEFAVRGNVVDLAVAVIIGAAFGKIVDSVVQDLIMPIIGKILGGLDLPTITSL